MSSHLTPSTARIPVAQPVFLGREKEYVNECLDTGWISSNGRFVNEFEARFASYCGVKHAIACANGTVTLHLAMLGLGIGPGDEVLVPTLTYIASANAVVYTGAKPVFVDSDPLTWNVCIKDLERKISPRSKAIMVVHLYGHPVDMDPIHLLAKKHGLFIIEDAAEAHGAQYKGKPTGGLGHIGSFSFFGNKTITTGEGGMLTLDDDEMAARLRILKGQGMDPKRRYWFPVVGYNYRMTNVQAAIGLGQLETIGEHLARRRQIAKWYTEALAPLSDRLDLPYEAPWARHSYWMYSVVLKESNRLTRDEVMTRMEAEGIETRPFFYPMHQLPPYKEDTVYPVAESLAARGMNLPTHAALNERDVVRVSDTLKRILMG